MKRFHSRIFNMLLLVSVVVYILFLLKLLLFKYYSPIDILTSNYEAYRSFNLIPFGGIYDYLIKHVTSSNLAVTNVLGNIVIFIPMGVLLRLYSSKDEILRPVAVVFVTSVTVEVIQYILGIGASDIDDVILNTFGGFLGVLLYMLLLKILRNRSRVKAFVTVTAVLCAAAVSFIIGRTWYYEMSRNKMYSDAYETHSIDLDHADLAGILVKCADDTIYLKENQEYISGKEIAVKIDKDTTFAILRYGLKNDIMFEPCEYEFFDELSDLPDYYLIWITTTGNGADTVAARVVISDPPLIEE
ncbi:MAG: VanZ family protein [Lachnospiraceae bacterium]